jgi:Tol biopolymer transport system component
LGRIAFVSDFDIYVINMDDGSLTNLTHHPGVDFDPDWSPDGKRIVFGSSRDDIEEIYVMNSDGSQQTRLTYNGATSTSSGHKFPAWSPDGKSIAFMRSCAVFITKIDGSEQTQLTSSEDSEFDWSPAWSSDGQWVVFSRIYNGPGGRGTGSDIYIINVDGSGLARLTNDSGFNSDPAWSPDGQQIAFISDRDGTDHLYIMKSDGEEETRITTRSEYERDPSWSPDRQWIVFTSYIDLRDQLYIIRTNGSQLTRLRNDVGEGIDGVSPAWAPVFVP